MKMLFFLFFFVVVVVVAFWRIDANLLDIHQVFSSSPTPTSTTTKKKKIKNKERLRYFFCIFLNSWILYKVI